MYEIKYNHLLSVEAAGRVQYAIYENDVCVCVWCVSVGGWV